MTYQEALSYIHSVTWLGSRPGLSRITELMHKIGDPQDTLRYIHVAGTNGKGSFCVMTESVLRAAGYRTGMFTSPYLVHFRERIQIDGQAISEALLADCTAQVKACADTMQDPPTEFELITAIGILAFVKAECDIVILEAGMGGRLDSTNIIKAPILSVITGIALDHTQYLGDTVEAIAAEKAGIIKEGCPVLFGGNPACVAPVIQKKADEMHAPYYQSDAHALTDWEFTPYGSYFTYRAKRYYLSLGGCYQTENAANVMQALDILRMRGYCITAEAIRRGLGNVYWPGRFECLRRDIPFYYDGGHNEQGVRACVESIRTCLREEKVIVLSGVMRDKDYDSMLSLLEMVCDCAVTVTPDNPRALASEEYAAAFASHGISAVAAQSVAEGVETATRMAREKGLCVLALGSLYLYAELRSAVESLPEEEK